MATVTNEEMDRLAGVGGRLSAAVAKSDWSTVRHLLDAEPGLIELWVEGVIGTSLNDLQNSETPGARARWLSVGAWRTMHLLEDCRARGVPTAVSAAAAHHDDQTALRLIKLFALADGVESEFDRSHDSSDLARAVQAWNLLVRDPALQRAPRPFRRRAFLAAGAARLKSQGLPSLSVIDDARADLRSSLELAEHGSRDQIVGLCQLALASRAAFTVTNQPDDLASAISSYQDALGAMAPDAAERAGTMHNLAQTLRIGHELTGDHAFLEQARQLLLDVNRIEPAPTGRAMHRASLASVILDERGADQDPEDLYMAHYAALEAVELAGPTAWQRLRWLDLAVDAAMRLLDRGADEWPALNGAIDAAAEILAATVPDNAEHALTEMRLLQLAMSRVTHDPSAESAEILQRLLGGSDE